MVKFSTQWDSRALNNRIFRSILEITPIQPFSQLYLANSSYKIGAMILLSADNREYQNNLKTFWGITNRLLVILASRTMVRRKQDISYTTFCLAIT